jgi:hypothetical protein
MTMINRGDVVLGVESDSEGAGIDEGRNSEAAAAPLASCVQEQHRDRRRLALWLPVSASARASIRNAARARSRAI